MFRKVASIPLWVDNAEKDKTYQTTTLLNETTAGKITDKLILDQDQDQGASI